MEEEQNSAEWQTPPIPEKIDASEPAQMSEVATLGGIFIEPGKTFEDLKRKPRFIMALVIIAILSSIYVIGLNYKVGEENQRRFVGEQIDKSPQGQNLTPEQRNSAIAINMKIGTVIRYAFPVIILIVFVIGGLLYWAGAKAFGGSGGFLHGMSVFTYSALPPALLSTVANVLVLLLKSADDIDLATSQRGVLRAGLSILVDGRAHPVISTVLGMVDLFQIWGWVLAAIGFRIVYKLSSTSAWTVTIIFALIGLLFKVLGAALSGNPS
jgi:hypothetical protein